MSQSTIISRSKNSEAPFSETQLTEIIDKNAKLPPQELASELTNKLASISSKHKFIVQYTSIAANEEKSFDLNIVTDFVASWEPTKDGCVTVKLDLIIANEAGGEASTLKQINSLFITVYWIAI
ncbi:hypothetical protein FOB58_000184 [Candida parapsilosis]|uniref:Topoisomerase I damage affected protein 2 n=2 Tax=Candida parapsilosis TaxID=5480 RepID=G8BE92_CANPC|nr:uncharacterized protein CPAR2_212330 [Candida parapsilosis]KAF6054262.1 hypothetical protein FOB58_000184 [Candida parapsilosis]KAF6056714.1 hypothetical protein FOB59_001226 [Candida parapsilosis]KAF6059649.1 hypothetical protein FOB60_001231 [Candida parapsilosis]KAF6068402.1 hypothetical protein FOB61_001227 [Candida parapsilosis]KAI5903095.1 hypothetical protein K4G60_g2240 [Candida parapsilosis]